MANTPNIFADRAVNISLTNSLMRIELATVQAPAAEGEKPQLVPSQTLVMPLDGFLASFGMMDAMIKKLVAEGVLKTQPPESAAAPAPVDKKK